MACDHPWAARDRAPKKSTSIPNGNRTRDLNNPQFQEGLNKRF